MTAINVSLSSTAYAIDDGVSTETNPLIKMDVPVCSANMGLGAFGFGPSEKEKLEHNWSKACLDMTKRVVIDPEKRSVYIGDDEGWLVEYEDDVKGPHADRFFQRWRELGIVFFEFTLLDFKSQPLFCIKGLWCENKWSKLDIFSSPTCTVI